MSWIGRIWGRVRGVYPEPGRGVVCPGCGQYAEFRACDECGSRAWVIDCDHYEQPAEIAAGRDDGSDPNRYFCAVCAIGLEKD